VQPLGCGPASASVGVGMRIPGPPTMVQISPGVWVVEDYDYPVYFSDGFYWYVAGGAWYRSPYWDHEFERYPRERVPVHLTSLSHEQFRHYQGPPNAERIRPGRGEQPGSLREARRGGR